jgi:hypothetical protein
MRAIPALAGVIGLVALSLPAAAADISLNEYAFNIDGTVSDITLGDALPAGVNVAGFDDVTGIGTVTVTVSGAGSHYVSMFVDHDITEQFYNPFDNEYGVVNGTPAAGQSWQIGEPTAGTIYPNFAASALDNTNGVPFGSENDVSMALASSFNLNTGETAAVTFLLSQIQPAGFSLGQFDGGDVTLVLPTGDAVFFSSNVEIRGGSVVPLPPAIILFGSGLATLLAARRRRSGSTA